MCECARVCVCVYVCVRACARASAMALQEYRCCSVSEQAQACLNARLNSRHDVHPKTATSTASTHSRVVCMERISIRKVQQHVLVVAHLLRLQKTVSSRFSSHSQNLSYFLVLHNNLRAYGPGGGGFSCATRQIDSAHGISARAREQRLGLAPGSDAATVVSVLAESVNITAAFKAATLPLPTFLSACSTQFSACHPPPHCLPPSKQSANGWQTIWGIFRTERFHRVG